MTRLDLIRVALALPGGRLRDAVLGYIYELARCDALLREIGL